MQQPSPLRGVWQARRARRLWADGRGTLYMMAAMKDVLANFPYTKSGTGAIKKASSKDRHGNAGAALGAESRPDGTPMICYGDNGSAARFFYCAKASKHDRDEGMDDADNRILARSCQAQAEAQRGHTVEQESGAYNKARIRKNNHPTVKPTELMRYLCRLVTPPGGTVLDPFMGSGSTGKATILEGFDFIGIEKDEEAHQIAEVRVGHAAKSFTIVNK